MNKIKSWNNFQTKRTKINGQNLKAKFPKRRPAIFLNF